MYYVWVLLEVFLNKELNSFDVVIICENIEILIFFDKEIFWSVLICGFFFKNNEKKILVFLFIVCL